MFFPGETITHRFIIPFAKNEIDYVIISYKQNEHIMLEKTITSIDLTEDSQFTTLIEYTLTQIESLLFEDVADFTMQLNVYTIGGSRHASYEVKSSSGVQYFREVMTDG